MTVVKGKALVEGTASGSVLVLVEPVSFWGGVDPLSGVIVDRNHPQAGTTISGAILLMRGSRGSSSASSVLAEMIRLGTAPAAMIVTTRDPILVLGSVVAEEIYGVSMPIVMMSEARFSQVAGAKSAIVGVDGSIEIGD